MSWLWIRQADKSGNPWSKPRRGPRPMADSSQAIPALSRSSIKVEDDAEFYRTSDMTDAGPICGTSKIDTTSSLRRQRAHGRRDEAMGQRATNQCRAKAVRPSQASGPSHKSTGPSSGGLGVFVPAGRRTA